jgi:hypothetical protein
MVGRVHGKPRRWVVERTNSWHNQFRGLLIRWERIAANYLALVQLACGLIAFEAAAVDQSTSCRGSLIVAVRYPAFSLLDSIRRRWMAGRPWESGSAVYSASLDLEIVGLPVKSDSQHTR